jgi:hypothetical protein
MLGAVSRIKQVGVDGPLQLGTPLASQRTAVTSTDQVPERLFELDPVGSAANVLPQATPFESQNWLRALTLRNDPLGIATVADWFLASGIDVAPAPAPPLATVKD